MWPVSLFFPFCATVGLFSQNRWKCHPIDLWAFFIFANSFFSIPINTITEFPSPLSLNQLLRWIELGPFCNFFVNTPSRLLFCWNPLLFCSQLNFSCCHLILVPTLLINYFLLCQPYCYSLVTYFIMIARIHSGFF